MEQKAGKLCPITQFLFAFSVLGWRDKIVEEAAIFIQFWKLVILLKFTGIFQGDWSSGGLENAVMADILSEMLYFHCELVNGCLKFYEETLKSFCFRKF